MGEAINTELPERPREMQPARVSCSTLRWISTLLLEEREGNKLVGVVIFQSLGGNVPVVHYHFVNCLNEIVSLTSTISSLSNFSFHIFMIFH